MSIIYLILAIATSIISLIAAYAIFIEPERLELRTVEIGVDGLPEALDGLTICHLSDLHVHKFGRLEERLLQMLEGLKCDICLVTGDLISSRKIGVHTFNRLINGFSHRLGTYAVPGNGEHKIYRHGINISELSELLKDSGTRLLVNESFQLQLAGCAINIVGVDDPFTVHDDLERAISGVSEHAFNILLAHSPDILVQPGTDMMDLALCGHTHGGQFRLPLIGAVWTHCRHNLGISDGYYDPATVSRKVGRPMPRVHLYVSRGIGGSGIRARFLCPPEVVLISLKKSC
jgi:hypothetical protein